MSAPTGTQPTVLDDLLSRVAERQQAGRAAEGEHLRRELSAAQSWIGAHALTGAAECSRRFGLNELVQRPRIWKYRALSTCRRVRGRPSIVQPVLFLGDGEIVIGREVEFGWAASPSFHTGYSQIEAATESARIEIGDGVHLNNNTFMKSEGAGIRIGANGLFGPNVEIVDSDFHDLHPERRTSGVPRVATVTIEENVFLGMGVKVLKGVTIGANSVIGAGAVVASSIPSGVIAAGNPARVIREL